MGIVGILCLVVFFVCLIVVVLVVVVVVCVVFFSFLFVQSRELRRCLLLHFISHIGKVSETTSTRMPRCLLSLSQDFNNILIINMYSYLWNSF